MVLDYFSEIFSSSNPTEFAAVLDCVPPRITPTMNAQLTRPVSAEEVRCALFQMLPSKSPGPDGMIAFFFFKNTGMWWDMT